MREHIIIDRIENNGKRIDVYFSATNNIAHFFRDFHFFIEYNFDVSDIPSSIAVIPLIANLIPFSMITNCLVFVEEIDKDFYFAVPNIKNAFFEMYNSYPFGGSLVAARLVKNDYPKENSIVQLFTGGVDATTTFFREGIDNTTYLFNLFNKRDCLEHLSDNNQKKYKYLCEFAQSYGKKAYFAESNYRLFINADLIDAKYYRKVGDDFWHGFQHGLSFLSAASLLGYVKKVKMIYIASSSSIGQDFLCSSDPRTDICFRCSSMEVIHDGYELTRMDKVEFLVNYQRQLNHSINLLVCLVYDYKNCCNCEKCCRTMLSIIAAGGDIKDFGFNVNNVLDTFKTLLINSPDSINNHSMFIWRSILNKMGERYSDLSEEGKELYDLIISFPLERQQKKVRRKHFWGKLPQRIKAKIFIILKKPV